MFLNYCFILWLFHENKQILKEFLKTHVKGNSSELGDCVNYITGSSSVTLNKCLVINVKIIILLKHG